MIVVKGELKRKVESIHQQQRERSFQNEKKLRKELEHEHLEINDCELARAESPGYWNLNNNLVMHVSRKNCCISMIG